MSIKPKILVTSAGGKTGLPVSLQLLERGYSLRAFVRTDDRRARLLRDAGAEIFVGDLYAVSDMRRAMQGVQRAYHCAPTAPNGLHFGSVFVVAAQESRLEHVVILDQWLSDPDHVSFFTRQTWLNQRLLALLPDTTMTVNNVGWFADNYFMVLETAAQLGILPLPLGPGDEKKDAPPSNEDIAAVSVEALIDPARHAGKVYRPTGPRLLTPNEVADAMGQALNRKVTYKDISEAMLSKAFKAQGAPEGLLTQFRLYCQEYRRGAFAVGAPSPAVPEVTGREAENFGAIAERYVASRPEAHRTLANRLRAYRSFAKLLLTRPGDFDRTERRRDHVLLQAPLTARDSEAWRKAHDPAAGFQPDRPRPAAMRITA